MIVVVEQPKCSAKMDDGKRECGQPACASVVLFETTGPATYSACKTHLLRMGTMLETIVQRQLTPAEPV